MHHREEKEEGMFRAVDDDIVRLNTVMGLHRRITEKVRQRLGKSLEKEVEEAENPFMVKRGSSWI